MTGARIGDAARLLPAASRSGRAALRDVGRLATEASVNRWRPVLLGRLCACSHSATVALMCGRFVSSHSADKIAQFFGASFEGEALPENFNVAPTTMCMG